jgi:hypothetical protein
MTAAIRTLGSLAHVGLVALLASACGVGGVDGGDDDDDGDELEGGTDNEQLGIKCRAELDTSGSFAVGMTKPDDITGCWPVGVWTFSASVVSNECDGDPALLSEYAFEITVLADADGELQQQFEYLSEAGDDIVQMDVSSGGGGLCEGGVQILSADGLREWNFKPSLQADDTLAGHGQYREYFDSQL